MPAEGSFLTGADVAQRYGIHPKTVARLVRAGRLECQRIGRLVRFSAAHLEKFERSENRRAGS